MAYKLIYNGGSDFLTGNFYPFLFVSGGSGISGGTGSSGSNWYTDNATVGTATYSIPTISDGTIISSSTAWAQSSIVPGTGQTAVVAYQVVPFIVLGPFNFSNFSSINIEVKSVTNSINSLAKVKIGYRNSLPTTSTGVSFTGSSSYVEVPQSITTLSYDISEVSGLNYIVIETRYPEVGIAAASSISKVYLQYKSGIVTSQSTLIGGTSHNITGGRTLIGETGYNITGGRTLINNTGYDINFGGKSSLIYNGGDSVINGEFTPRSYIMTASLAGGTTYRWAEGGTAMITPGSGYITLTYTH